MQALLHPAYSFLPEASAKLPRDSVPVGCAAKCTAKLCATAQSLAVCFAVGVHTSGSSQPGCAQLTALGSLLQQLSCQVRLISLAWCCDTPGSARKHFEGRQLLLDTSTCKHAMLDAVQDAMVSAVQGTLGRMQGQVNDLSEVGPQQGNTFTASQHTKHSWNHAQLADEHADKEAGAHKLHVS